MSHRPKERAGQRETQYRVKKHQHQRQNIKAKQQKESIIRPMQNHEGATRQTASQVELVVRSEPKPTEMEDAQVGGVDGCDAPQSCEEADQINTPPPFEQNVSQEAGSDEEMYVTSFSGLPVAPPESNVVSQPEHTHNLPNDTIESNEVYLTEQSESSPQTEKKTLTGRQVREDALQRRKRKMKVRSQLVREQRGLALDVHEHETQDLHDQTQQCDVERHAQRDIDQWYAHDEEDDTESEMRKAEEHIRSAADAAGEVYKDSLQGKEQEEEDEEDRNDEDNKIAVHSPRSNATTLFPGDPIERQAHYSEREHVLSGSTGTQVSDEIQTGPSDRRSSRRDRMKPIHNNVEFLKYVAAHPSLGMDAPRTHERQPDTVLVNADTDPQTGRPKSLFPGQSFDPTVAKDATTDTQLSAQAAPYHHTLNVPSHGGRKNARTPLPNLPHQTGNSAVANLFELSRRRKFEDETEETNVHIRTFQDHSPAQLKHWESMKDEVASVEQIWDEFEDDKIYVTSTVDIERLASRRHPKHKRLWSWKKK